MKVRTMKAMESEYASYRRDVEVKLARFTEMDEDVYRLKAEVEELKLRNERMQKRLSEKEDEI